MADWKPPKSKPIRMKVSANLHEYLLHLARTTNMGRDQNDVALWVLSTQLEAMRHTPRYAYRFADEPAPDEGHPSPDKE